MGFDIPPQVMPSRALSRFSAPIDRPLYLMAHRRQQFWGPGFLCKSEERSLPQS